MMKFWASFNEEDQGHQTQDQLQHSCYSEWFLFTLKAFCILYAEAAVRMPIRAADYHG